MNLHEIDTIRRLLCQLGLRIRETLATSRQERGDSFSVVDGRTSSDTIYLIDRISEKTITAWLESEWPPEMPIQLVMEGIEDRETVTFPQGTPLEDTCYKLIIDPIDGTRNLMYDKRAGWSLAGVAPQRGPNTTLEDIVVAAMTELPPSRQDSAYQLSASRCGDNVQLVAQSHHDGQSEGQPASLSPSPAKDLRHGFASVAKFFPAAKALLAKFEEDLFCELLGASELEEAIVFDDQYISTGGQLFELISGRDRFALDLRPMAYRKLQIEAALACHPYDLCALLVARQAGVVVETPKGGPLSLPLDTTTPVSWVGYANPVLANAIRPILSRLIDKHFS